jgi:hypothetical protein
MSLLHLVHKNVVLKFSDAAKAPFTPEASYAFRLTGVDGMGFLQIQELSKSATSTEPVGAAFWVNKDLIREIHEFDQIKDTASLTYTGKAAPVVSEAKIKVPKKSVLKQKPVFN